MNDEFFYVTFLTIHIVFGVTHIDKIPKAYHRNVCTLIGLVTSVLLTGWDFVHQLALCSLTIVTIVLHRQTKAFNLYPLLNCIAFGYLFYFRFYCANNFSNMIMMMLALRMGGLGVELSEPEVRTDSALYETSIKDIVHYAFSYIGLLAGPYIRFRTFMDFMDGVCSTTFVQRKPFLMSRLAYFPIFITMFFASIYIAPIQPAKTAEFHDESGFFYTVWYMWVMFVGFRARLYIGFLLAECSCIASGLGAYPEHWVNRSGEGPKFRKILTDGDADRQRELNQLPGEPVQQQAIDFNTVCNVDVWGCEGSPTLKETMRSWNQTVQYWLAVNCYKRAPFNNRSIRMGITLIISAFWHGVSPGYYFCFITMVFFATAEDYLLEHFSEQKLFKIPTRTVQRILFAQIKMVVVAYLGVAFAMMRLPEIFLFYWNLYFVGHLGVAAILCYFFVAVKKSKAHIH